MGENTAISWTNHTWNPWVGCWKISQGCRNCYMYREQKRYGNDPKIIRRSSPATFYAPLKWKDGAKVFTCSWSDFFIEEADNWRNDAYNVMWHTQELTYQVLTKRPERLRECLPVDWDDSENIHGWQHVWLGTSVELQDYVYRLDYLLRADAKVLFLSAEPLLGPLDLREYLDRLSWVIVGGESGAGNRPMDLSWARSIRDQCQEAGIPFFFKQVGGSKKIDGTWGGDLLDGKQYHEFPVLDTPRAQQLTLEEAQE